MIEGVLVHRTVVETSKTLKLPAVLSNQGERLHERADGLIGELVLEDDEAGGFGEEGVRCGCLIWGSE